jgi:hypothetical protein
MNVRRTIASLARKTPNAGTSAAGRELHYEQVVDERHVDSGQLQALRRIYLATSDKVSDTQ